MSIEFLTSFILFRTIRILNAKPELANDDHPSILTALQAAAVNRKPADVDPILLQSTTTTSPPAVAHGAGRGSRPLHYACLLGDMKIAEVLLSNGAEWTISDGNDLLPEDYVGLNGDGKKQEFKRLCAKHREDEESRRAGKLVEELELAREKEKKKLESLKKHEEQKELEKSKKSGEEELSSHHKRQRKWFPFPLPLTVLTVCLIVDIEKIIGDKIIGQRGPIWSIASAIRLRENGWVDPDRPLVMLFLGSSGIGKTELAKQVAYYLHGDESGQSVVEIEKSGAFVRIDMSEYQHSHTVSNLTGTRLSP